MTELEKKLLSRGHITSKNNKKPPYVTVHIRGCHWKMLAASSRDISILNLELDLPFFSCLIRARK